MSRRSEKLMFPGSQGGKLAALLEWPTSTPRAFALFAHCFACSKDVFAAARISAGLAERGIAVLRFDFTGLGHSEGEFANTNFSSNIGDLVAAVSFLRARFQAPKLLIGHSLGGAAILAAAEQVPEAVAVATIGAPAEPSHLRHLLVGGGAAIEAEGQAEMTLGGKRFRVTPQLLEDIEAQRLAGKIHALRKALLVFHSPRDEIVSIDNASAIFLAARHPKSFVSLGDADHLLSRRADGIYVAEVLAAWASRYLGEGAEAATGPAAAAAGAAQPAVEPGSPGEVVVAEAGARRYANAVTVRQHRLSADEPVDAGGGDSGPGPYELLLSALGACTSITVRMYADRKGFPLERVIVRLAHQKIHAVDCADCEVKEGKIDRMDRMLEFQGPLSEEQRQRLREIADKCPVHRTLESKNLIVTRMVGTE